MDFTIKTYKKLLDSLIDQGFSFLSIKEFVSRSADKGIILRHDVDAFPWNSLQFAIIQAKKGIKGSYYFRIVPQSFNEKIIREIYRMGHEIGYHYETMDTFKGNVDMAYDEFCRNLEMFRKIVPVKTVCMHGSPLSKYDNRLIWEKYDYKKLGIIAEPSMDIDFNQVFYITDTGRMWDGNKVSVRDKPLYSLTAKWPVYHSTFNIIKALTDRTFPDIAMITFHPQRWTNNQVLWFKELVTQNLKNQVKRFLVKY